MKIVIALDSYKGSISSTAAADALASGLHSVAPNAEIAELTLADGGEGSLEAFAAAWNAEIFSVPAHDALMNPVEGKFAVSGTTAIVELAQICGLAQLGDGKSPLKATSFGFGEVIFHAVKRGAKRIICCIGGSASTDGGMGMFQALGGVIRHKNGTRFADGIGGGGLADIAGIDSTILKRNLAGIEVITASDVISPLYGKSGAAWVFAPQKGADESMVTALDGGLRHLSTIAGDTAQTPGDGAAGDDIPIRLSRAVAAEKPLCGVPSLSDGFGREPPSDLSWLRRKFPPGVVGKNWTVKMHGLYRPVCPRCPSQKRPCPAPTRQVFSCHFFVMT